MPAEITQNSVGLVRPEIIEFEKNLSLDCGQHLSSFKLAYETYGTLNKEATNAVLICHALSSDHHAAGYYTLDDKKPGWWDSCIGPGKPFDTNKFFVVCCNNIGGCKGSTGPNTLNEKTNQLYGPDFPIVTVKDWVKSQSYLADALGIKKWACVAGGSLGGMQAIQWAIDYPQRLANALVIAAAPKLSAQNIGFNEVARQAIISDPEFHAGRYYEHDTVPRRGLSLARMLGHITYLSDDSMRAKFGRELREGKLNFGFDVDFQVESYLRHQGQAFVDKFDANTYLLITKVLDYFDPALDYESDLSRAFENSECNFLVASFTSDWRFPPERSREIVKALLDTNKEVTYAEIEANQGHDAFLLPIPNYIELLTCYMSQVDKEVNNET